MKKILSFAIMMMAILGFTACQHKNDLVKWTEFKSGIINYDVTYDTVKGTQVHYIDRYGKDYFEYDLVPGRINSLSTQIDSIGYMIFLDSNTGFKYQPHEQSINWLNLTDETVNKYQIKKIGREKIMGHMCDKYSSTISGGHNADVTEWIWKGLPLKRICKTEGSTFTQIVTNMQINVKIPVEKITIPEGIDYDNWKNSNDSLQTEE